MNKLVGYLIAIVGLVITFLSLNLTLINITLPEQIKPVYIMIFGIALVIFGVFITLGKSKRRTNQSEEEVPIYEGTGKKRKIVGYHRAR